jgi:protein SCO1
MHTKHGPLFLTALGLLACREPSPEPASRASPHRQEDAVAEKTLEANTHAAHEHAHQALEAAPALAGQSIYNFKAKLTDQDGKDFELASLRGSAVLATMFYASCTSICPMLIAQLKHLDDAIPANERSQTQLLLVSLDPDRDTPDKLKELAQQHGIVDVRWHFLRAAPNDVRELAALLGIRYRRLPSGDILHSPLIALLDRAGVIAARQENAADSPAPLLAKLDQALRGDVALAQ